MIFVSLFFAWMARYLLALKPSFANFMEGSMSFAHSNFPNLSCAALSPLSSPGTPTDKGPRGKESDKEDVVYLQLNDNVVLRVVRR